MLQIPNPDYGEREHKVGLLLHIGRDIKRRGEAGFNLEMELTGYTRHPTNERFSAYQWLIENRLIRVDSSEVVHDCDGSATFIKVSLTERGKELYDKAERSYGKFLDSLSSDF